MTAYLLLDHLLNFIAPAAVVALFAGGLAGAVGRLFGWKRRPGASFLAQTGVVFVANLVVLVIGLLLLGRDGKMTSYAAMVLATALVLTAQHPAGKR